jgi:CubicO group peptidase (beta-lactamase class C family)
MIRGYVHDDFRPVADQLAKQLRAAGSGGAAVCVYHRGLRVVDCWAGTRNGQGDPWEASTMALSFSTTKGVMATLVHTLVDRGLLDYDDPVAKYWPEFAQAGKERITVRQILSHQAGLYPIRTLIDHADRMLDWEFMAAALAASTPVCEPGSRSGYHGITYGWLVGELVRRVTNLSLADAVRTILSEPLGLDGLYIGAPPHERDRLAVLLAPAPRVPTLLSRIGYWILRGLCALLGLDPVRTRDALLPLGGHEVFFSARVLDAEIPAFNGVFTARSLARMYAMLASGGELDGTRFISSDTIRRATQVQSRRLDAIVGFPMRWRLGYHLVGTDRGILPNAFGHFGYGGSGAWADPDRNLAVAMTLNRVAGTPFGDMRMVRIGGIAARCAERRG